MGGQLKQEVEYACEHASDINRYESLLRTWAAKQDIQTETWMMRITLFSVALIVFFLLLAGVYTLVFWHGTAVSDDGKIPSRFRSGNVLYLTSELSPSVQHPLGNITATVKPQVLAEKGENPFISAGAAGASGVAWGAAIGFVFGP